MSHLTSYDSNQYSDYFQTTLPSHWKEKRLNYIAEQNRNSFVDGPFGSDLKTSDYKDTGIPLIQLNNIRDGQHILRNIKFITAEKKDELARHIALPNDVVIAKMADPVARAAIVSDRYSEFVIVADCVKFTPDLNLIDLHYLIRAINCDCVRINAELVSTGTTRIRINLSELKKLKIPYPPLQEQTQIAAFLDHETAKIDTLIEKQQKLIELLKEKRQAVISHAVTKGLNPDAPMKDSGVEWLGKVPEHWEISRLKHILTEPMKNGLFKKKDQFGSGSPLVNVTDLYVDGFFINSNNLERVATTKTERETYKVEFGDIFFVRSSLKLEGIGKAACFLDKDSDTVFECHIVNAKPDKNYISPKYLTRYLNSTPANQEFVRRSKTTTMTTIDQMSLATISVVIPPLREQQKIDSYLDLQINNINKASINAENSITLLKERRTALISAAVTGKIDVRNWVAPTTCSDTNEVQQEVTA
ncbi:type I site-specific deoxyribonuclease [Photobacterium leiognathi lrivu.4.1]|uniref:Type I site-specific deoxyribonuclease n=1 Tax=Photobacterium leiognathi lrivu.4.1 TaxID=1248232 RepID=V5F6H7_PHOLE|nr:restriction endonuclease subunit S [Photobacterium leiognathi]GAD28397.1 type I site-specific deoxyribonuclease [Photobacterium leiognathi lrivu.4.1]